MCLPTPTVSARAHMNRATQLAKKPLALQPLADARLDEGPSMIDRPPGPPLDGETAPRR
jgi:hypothetical protein